jgi:hypothetical protein
MIEIRWKTFPSGRPSHIDLTRKFQKGAQLLEVGLHQALV